MGFVEDRWILINSGSTIAMASIVSVSCDLGWQGWTVIIFAVICVLSAMQGDSGDDNPHGDSSLFG